DAGRTLLLAYQTLGIVYGDIGTSPLYVLPSSVLENPTREDFLGIFSIIFWTLTIIPLIKYVFIVLRADDNGEGGTFALYSYLCRHINFRNNLTIQDTRLPSDSNLMYYQQGSTIKNKSKAFIEKSNTAQFLLTFFVLLGTCMVIGDGALTPATSVMVTSPRSNLNVIFSFAAVLSALSGIQTLSPKITTNYVVLMAVILLLILFYFQRFGTSKVSCSFSPIMFLWFATNAAIGLYNIVNYHPSILKGISPYYMFKFFQRRKRTGWELLGAAFLCTSGAEAMFADLGHFNKRSIQIAFSAFVYPSLVLCYAGEAAYLIQNPEKLSTAYYSSIPTPVYWPMFVIATLSAVVASQSMISATFSIVKQSLALGCFPRVNMLHTSSKHEGQVYSPEVNFILGILCIALVVGFKQGVEIGNAYGVAIICVMLITTSLVTVVMLVIWDTNFLLILAFFVPFLFIEGCFLSAMVNKIPLGGWVPFAIASFFMIIMLSWTSGRSKKTKYDSERKLGFEELHRILYESNLHHPSGICLFCADLVNGIPPIIRHYIHNTNSLREITIIVTIRTLPIKTVLPEERFDVAKVGFDGVYRCLIQFGYKDEQSLEGNAVRLIVEKLKEISESTEEAMKLDSALDKGVVFVTGRTILKSNENNGWLTRWTINYLYRFLQKNSVSAVSSLKIPPENFMQVASCSTHRPARTDQLGRQNPVQSTQNSLGIQSGSHTGTNSKHSISLEHSSPLVRPDPLEASVQTAVNRLGIVNQLSTVSQLGATDQLSTINRLSTVNQLEEVSLEDFDGYRTSANIHPHKQHLYGLLDSLTPHADFAAGYKYRKVVFELLHKASSLQTQSNTTMNTLSRGNRHFTVDGGRLRQSGPRPDTRLLHQPALEGLTRSAWTDSPRKIGQNKFRRSDGGGGGGGVHRRRRRGFWRRGEAALRARYIASRGPTTIAAPESQFRIYPTDHDNTLSSVSVRESRIQYLCDPQWFSACKNQLVVVSVQYGPFNPYIPIRSTTIGKSRVAIDPIAMRTSWRSNSDIASVTSIGYPRMSASGESSTTMHRLLHASGSHPIPPPDDPK
ncbi:potassium transporter 26-like, partial [Dorcoceras hygrometricum]